MKIENEDYWSAFEKTGSVDAYLLYSKHRSDMQNTSRQEAAKDADQDRWAGHPRAECGRK